MVVNVVSGGNLARRAMMYRPPTEEMRAYFQNNLLEASSKLGESHAGFLEQSKAVYEQYNSDAAILAAKTILMNSTSHLSQDVIHGVTHDTIQDANLITQRFIMAQPDLNKLYQKNMCNGFEETYFERESGVDPVWRTDYLAATDGLMQFDDDESYITFNSWDTEDTPELDAIEKFTIADTWSKVVDLINEGIDPSDIDRGAL